ncbi:DUF4160 domain-containing protein [Rhizobium ruizarguesonis]|uniref:DUF4160 domain-containing protein n=1 Tax=Rhizobium ruizarguesonis TaxID=2081791 RepID=UPI001FD0AB80|nr:DUF4160 domain-containing protein [Rhizobium ruizarguesonis]
MEMICIPLDDALQRELEHLLGSTGPGGYTVKHIVSLIDGKLRVEVRANEHPPPHFHVTYDGQDASFSIVTGERLAKVRGLERYEKTIRLWWSKHKCEIVQKWNECRPANCPVGAISLEH